MSCTDERMCVPCFTGQGACSELMPHKVRVVAEKVELDQKLGLLLSFISSSETLRDLSAVDSDLLRQQAKAMEEYSKILGRRIEGFNSLTPMVVFRRMVGQTAADPLANSDAYEDVAVPASRLGQTGIYPLPSGMKQDIRFLSLGELNVRFPGMKRL